MARSIHGSLRTLPRLPLIIISLGALLLAADDAIPETPSFDPDVAALLLSMAIGTTALLTAAAGGADRRLMIRAVPRVTLGLFVSVVVTTLALLSAELATRWIYRDITTTSDDRGYFSHRWLRSGAVSYNPQGFRERPFAPTTPAGAIRIAVLGDSFAFGNGIAAEQRFSSLLQASLPANIEVLNYGVPGDNAPQHVVAMRRVLRFSPDYVLLQWFVNDVEGSDRERPRTAPLLPFPRMHDGLHESSALYTFANTWWTRRQVLGSGTGSYAGYLRARYENPQAEAVRLDRVAMRALATAARGAGIGLGIVMFPDAAYDLGPAYPFAFLHARVLQLCDEQRLTCLDLRPDFATVKRRESLWANRLDTHPSAIANMIAATRIRKVFEPRWRDLAAAR